MAAYDSLKLCLTFQWTKSTASAAVESPCGWFFSAYWLPWEKWTASFLSSYFNLYSWQIFFFYNFFVLFRWQRRNSYSGLQKSTCENAWNMFFYKIFDIYIYTIYVCMYPSMFLVKHSSIKSKLRMPNNQRLRAVWQWLSDKISLYLMHRWKLCCAWANASMQWTCQGDKRTSMDPWIPSPDITNPVAGNQSQHHLLLMPLDLVQMAGRALRLKKPTSDL